MKNVFFTRFARILISIVALAMPLAIPSIASAQASSLPLKNNACSGANLDLSGKSTNCTQGTTSFDNILKTVINVMSVIVGAVAVIMIIIGGFRYIVSGGESSGVSGAKNTILFAIVGLIIVVLAQVFVQFVLNRILNGVQ